MQITKLLNRLAINTDLMGNLGMRYIKRIGFCLCIFLSLVTNAQEKFETPEQYAKVVKIYFDRNQWEKGKGILHEAMERFATASDLQWLMGRYWYHYKDYNQARYHLIKSIQTNYNNVEAKQLLVNVEEETQNYSSAICYVNELLEVNPYWRGLWRRKIELYRKAGNDVEADRLLRRINQIYPNDTLINRYYLNSLEEDYIRHKKLGERKRAIEVLTELVNKSPANESYFADLANFYLQEGDKEQSLKITSKGIAAFPESSTLIAKKVGLLSELGRNQEAMLFLREKQKQQGNSSQLNRLYNDLILETARTQRQQDPYVLYGMAYAKGQKSKEVIEYLVTTAVNRKYNEEALGYIREARRIYGNSKWVLYNEYLLYRNMNKDNQAFGVLQRLAEEYPDDRDLKYDFCQMQMERAAYLMSLGNFAEALPYAKAVATAEVDDELAKASRERLISCYTSLKRYKEAMEVLDELAILFPDTENIIGKKAFLLDKMGKTPEAIQLYLSAIENAQEDTRILYLIGLEEIAIPYIKSCIDAGATRLAYTTAAQLVALNPANDLALRYAINCSGALGQFDDFRKYTQQGLSYYPEEPFYKIKQATLYNIDRDHQSAIQVLRPVLERYPGQKELIDAFSESAECRALVLLKGKQLTDAMTIVDTALVVNPGSRSLKYTKGLIFEANRQADSAYYYQKFYEPTLEEQAGHKHHLMGLKNETFNNRIGMQYLQSRHADIDQLRSIATLDYTLMGRKNDYTFRVNYAGRDGEAKYSTNEEEGAPGGVGIQLQGEWVHRWNKKWTFQLNAAYATQYFPQLAGNLSLARTFASDWEVNLHLGYRKTESYEKTYVFNSSATDPETGVKGVWETGAWSKTYYDLLLAGIGISKSFNRTWLNGKFDGFRIQSKFYYNASLEGRFFFLDDKRSYISGMMGMGTAPESNILDFALPGSFDHLNSLVGLGATYLITPNVAIGLLGTWQTYYNQISLRQGNETNYKDVTKTKYKNLYNIYVQVSLFF